MGSVLFAWQLLEAEGGDPDVVIPAVILHDVGWSRLTDDEQHRAFGPPPRDVAMNKLHEQQGAEIATEILRSVGYDPALTEEIAEIIRGHDNRREALSLNDALVKDADRLFRLTRRGYMIFLEFFTPRVPAVPRGDGRPGAHLVLHRDRQTPGRRDAR